MRASFLACLVSLVFASLPARAVVSLEETLSEGVFEEFGSNAPCYRVEYSGKAAKMTFPALPGKTNTRKSSSLECSRKKRSYKCQLWLSPTLQPFAERPAACAGMKLAKSEKIEASFDNSRVFNFLLFEAEKPVVKPIYDLLVASGMLPEERPKGTLLVSNQFIAASKIMIDEQRQKDAGVENPAGPLVYYALHTLLNGDGELEGLFE